MPREKTSTSIELQYTIAAYFIVPGCKLIQRYRAGLIFDGAARPRCGCWFHFTPPELHIAGRQLQRVRGGREETELKKSGSGPPSVNLEVRCIELAAVLIGTTPNAGWGGSCDMVAISIELSYNR